MVERRSWKALSIEATVIVGSILLAFAIDASWDSRQRGLDNQEVRESLRRDFVVNEERLSAVLVESENAYSSLRELLRVSSEGTSLPVDSLRRLARPLLRPREFRAVTSAYRSAVATGQFADMTDPQLVEALMRFEDARAGFEALYAVALENWFLGRGYDLRRTLGSVTVLAGATAEGQIPARFLLSDAEYREFFESREFYAFAEASAALLRTQLVSLRQMETATRQVLDRLGER